MATTHEKTTPRFDGAFERNGYEQVRESSEQFVAIARRAGYAYLDTYEKAVDRAIDLELKLADLTRQAWIKDLVEAQTDLQRELAGSYSSTARTLLK
jgi:hypothetical protein